MNETALCPQGTYSQWRERHSDKLLEQMPSVYLSLMMAKTMKTKKDKVEEEVVGLVEERSYRETEREKGQRKRGGRGARQSHREEAERREKPNLDVLDIGPTWCHISDTPPKSLESLILLTIPFSSSNKHRGSRSKVCPIMVHH